MPSRIRLILVPGVGYNDLLIFLTSRALRDHRLINSTLTAQGIRLQTDIDIGLAVKTE
jgi:hypothetical protein